MMLMEYMRDKALRYEGGLTKGGSPDEVSRLTFIGNEQSVRDHKLREYDVWYGGDGDELLNLYNKSNMIDYGLEPWYWKNARSYFWCVSSTEDDIKRTHSGQPRNIVDTLCGLVGVPRAAMGALPRSKSSRQTDRLSEILDSCRFWDAYSKEQVPLTLVEGWGCWKVSWDLALSDHPFASYYPAQDVDFIYRAGKVSAIVFRDWYVGVDPTKRYLVTEFRCLVPRHDGNGRLTRDLRIETQAWTAAGGGADSGDSIIIPADIREVPELAGTESEIVINDFGSLLAEPCVFWRDAKDRTMGGRSIFSNKIELFDDLDQELSQKSNTVRRSTPEELFDTDFLQRDPETNLPIMPKVYDRKYVSYAGGGDANGNQISRMPVQTTQPQLNISQYSESAIATLSHILSGLMSPATMGIGVAAQSTQESQREKEKVTVSTVNHIDCEEERILKDLFSDMLSCDDYLRTGAMGKGPYDVTVQFSDFSDKSFEDKEKSLGDALANGAISPEMYMKKMYGDSLSDDEWAQELDYLRKTHDPSEQQGEDPLSGLDGSQEGGKDEPGM